MKLALLCLSLLTLTLALPNFSEYSHYIMDGYEELEHTFGALHMKKETDLGTDSVIVWPKLGFLSEEEHFKAAYKRMKEHKNFSKNITIEQCDAGEWPEAFKILPKYIKNVIPDGTTENYSTPCFQNNTVTANIIDNTTIEFVFTVENATSLLCQDAYFFATTENYHVDSFFFRGSHTVTFKNLSLSQYEEIIEDGIGLFRFCDHLLYFLPDALLTVGMFIGSTSSNPNAWFGSKPPFWMVDDNIDFVKDTTGYVYELRPEAARKSVVDLDISLIKSGDFVAVDRFGGTPQIIHLGSGSTVGHSTVALWVEDELYILESNGGWWWPRQGIQMNPWSTWVEWCNNADCMVTWLPLKEEYSQKFNATAAYEWFKNGIEGLPYGYHNFIYGWVDTPHDSYPPLMEPELIAPVFAILEKISPDDAISILSSGLNMRLNTTNLTIPELAQVIYERNTTFADLYAVVEQDDWVYYDGYSRVCSAFVVDFWKHGGLFDGYEIQATEWTPRDIYQLEFIDPAPVVPENCKAVDPENPYCQIMGEYRIKFFGVSTVSVYSNMNQYCPSLPPYYERTPGC